MAVGTVVGFFLMVGTRASGGRTAGLMLLLLRVADANLGERGTVRPRGRDDAAGAGATTAVQKTLSKRYSGWCVCVYCVWVVLASVFVRA